MSDGKAHAKFTLPALILGYSAEIKMDVDDHAAFFNRCFFGRDAHRAHGNPFGTLRRGEIPRVKKHKPHGEAFLVRRRFNQRSARFLGPERRPWDQRLINYLVGP